MLYSGVLQRLSNAAVLIIEETCVRWRVVYMVAVFACMGTVLAMQFENTRYATLSHMAHYALLVAVYYMSLLFYICSFQTAAVA